MATTCPLLPSLPWFLPDLTWFLPDLFLLLVLVLLLFLPSFLPATLVSSSPTVRVGTGSHALMASAAASRLHSTDDFNVTYVFVITIDLHAAVASRLFFTAISTFLVDEKQGHEHGK
jgi:hypothetical protein